MGWCGSSMPGTPEFQTMNEEGHKCAKGILANDSEALNSEKETEGVSLLGREPSSSLLSDGEQGRDFGFIVSCCQTIEQIK
jgi:hypothetical protein